MIPLFKPSTAKKEVNKTQGDGELAKLANLNRLVEDINTIVAQGLPAASPVLTYNATGGSVSTMRIGYLILTDQYTNGGTGNVTIQSYYVPSIEILDNVTATSLTFYTQYVSTFSTGGGSNVNNLTTLNFPNLIKQIGDPAISISGITGLTTVSLPLCTTGFISINQCNNLTTVDVSSMVNGKSSIRIDNCALMNLSSLIRNPQFSGFTFDSCPNLESVISLPVTDVYIQFGNCDGVTSISFPNAVHHISFSAQSCDNLTTVSLGSIGTIKQVTGLTFYNSALNSASVTHILDVLISLDGTNGTILFGPGEDLNISGGTNAIPSVGDLAKIAILEGRGATVTYNT